MAHDLHSWCQVITVLPTSPEFPLGRRAERLVRFDVGETTAKEVYYWDLPGVLVKRDAVYAAWDYAPTLAALLEVECPSPPLSAPVPLPGLAEYTARIKDHLRPHQRDGIRFLVRRAWAYCADDMRTGKSLTALAAARLAGSKHALIITTANAKPGWTREIVRWYGVVPVVLEGRAGASAREVCVACRGRGVVLRDDAPIPCGECGGKGNALVSVKSAGKQLEPEIFETGDATVWPPRYRGCRKHKDKIQDTATECAACRSLLTQTVRQAPFVVVNYDIINGQRERDAEGGLVRRLDLPGWTSLLMSGHFDTVLLDEAHVLRAIDYKSIQKTRKARGERIYDAVIDVPRVWALSGTPSCGFVRDLWPQYNIISKGLFGPEPFAYGKRYADAHSGDYGWDDSGHGYLADAELPQRQAVFVIRRTMAEVAPHMPAITHQLVELEMSDADGRELRDGRNWALEGKKAVESEVRRLSAVKHDAVAEAMCDEMANGHKTFALTYHVEDARRLAKVIAKLMESNQYRVLSRKHNAKLWVIAGGERSSGGTTDGACMEFVEHAGAALMVATTKSLQGGVSLRGAVSCHHVDFSDDPTEMAQAQRRPFEMDAGLTGYTCVYYVVRGTVDDRLERIILPKLETMSVLAPTAENSTIRAALTRETNFSAWDAAWEAIGQSAAGRDDIAGIAEDVE